MTDAPKLFRAIADFVSAEADDLSFKAGDTIVVTDMGTGPQSWWEGELDGRFGCFPGTYVRPLRDFLPTAAPVGMEIKTEMTEAEVREQEAREQNQQQAQPDAASTRTSQSSEASAPKGVSSPSILKAKSRTATSSSPSKRVSFSLANQSVEHTFSPGEYSRGGDFDPIRSHQEWELEEPRERLRMLFDRWDYLESTMPPGSKCEERLAYEEQERQKEVEAEKKRQRRLEAKLKIQQRRMKREKERLGAISNPTATSPAPTATVTALTDASPTSTYAEKPPGATRAERLRLLKEKRAAMRKADEEQAVAENLPQEKSSSNVEASSDVSSSTSPLLKKASSRSAAPPPRPANSSKPPADATSDADASPKTAAKRTSATDSSDDAPLDAAIRAVETAIEELKKQDSRGKTGYYREFMYLDAEDRKLYKDKSKQAGLGNKDKNRYNDIIPYDDTRVVVGDSDDIRDNYLNASHIKNLLPGSPHFVAAQGPMPNSVDAFWKMVTQTKSRVIVMVTNCQEGAKTKCEKYWPDEGKNMSFQQTGAGDALQVMCLSEEKKSSWVKRTFRITRKVDGVRTDHTVDQLHFLSWPDRGVPSNSTVFLSFIHQCMALQNAAHAISRKEGEEQLPPMTVHCSAGVGRTGVFMLVYSIMTYLPFVAKGGKYKLKVMPIVKRMRNFRRYLVQTVDQYEFCYDTILYAMKFYRKGTNKLKRESAVDADQEPESTADVASADEPPQRAFAARVLVLDSNNDNNTAARPREEASLVMSQHSIVPASDDESSDDGGEPIKPWGAWHHPSRSLQEGVDILRSNGDPGMFLITGSFEKHDGVALSHCVSDSSVRSVRVVSKLDGFALKGMEWTLAPTVQALVQTLAKPGPDWVEPLSSFIPYLNASNKEIAEEMAMLKTAAASPVATRTTSGSVSAFSRDLTFRSRNQGSSRTAADHGHGPTGGSNYHQDGKKKTFRWKKLKSKLKRNKGSNSDLGDAPVAPYLAQPVAIDDRLLFARFRANGDIVRIASKTPLLAFVDGCYAELEEEHDGYPAYKIMHPVESQSAITDEMSVYLVVQPEDRAVLLYAPQVGAIAACQARTGDPVSIFDDWHVFVHGVEVLQPITIALTRVEGTIPAHEGLRSRALAIEHELGKAKALLKVQEVKAQQLEKELSSVRTACANPYVEGSATLTVSKEQWKNKEELVQSLTDEVAKLGMAEEGLSRRVERLEKRLEEKDANLNQSVLREQATSAKLDRAIAEIHTLREASTLQAPSLDHDAVLTSSPNSQPTTGNESTPASSGGGMKRVLDLSGINDNLDASPRSSILMDEANQRMRLQRSSCSGDEEGERAQAQPRVLHLMGNGGGNDDNDDDDDDDDDGVGDGHAADVEGSFSQRILGNVSHSNGSVSPLDAHNDDENDGDGDDDDEHDVDDSLVMRLMGRRATGQAAVRDPEAQRLEEARREAQRMASMFAENMGISDDTATSATSPSSDLEGLASTSYVAVRSFASSSSAGLSFEEGETINVTEEQGKFFLGECRGRRGWFPKEYVATTL